LSRLESPPTDLRPSALEAAAPAYTEPWFRTLADTTSTAIFVYQADRVVYTNRAAAELSGYSREEMLAMLPWQICYPEDRAMAEERAAARLRGEEPPPRYEIRIRRKDGEMRWLEVTAGRIDSAEGEPAALVNAVDVTERKATEEALRQSGQSLELAQRVAGSVVWEWDLASDAMRISPHATEVLGCRPEEIWKTGAEFIAAVHPEDQPGLVEALGRCLREGSDFELELRLVLSSGATFWVSERGRALFDEHGVAVRMIGVAQNISRSKLEEARLRAIVEGTAATTGTDFLRSLAEHLARALGVRIAFISEAIGAPPRRARILARWTGGELGAPLEFDLAGTPSEWVFQREVSFFPRGVAELFPEDRLLAEHRIESYLAIPLFGSDGRPLGHMGVMDTSPWAEEMPAISILRIFAARAAAEIERQLAEDALAQEKERAQVTLASIGDGVIRTDLAGTVDYMNPVAERLTGWPAEQAYGRRVREVFRVVDEVQRRALPNPAERCMAEERLIQSPGYALLLGPAGEEFIIRESAAPIRDRAGRIAGSVLVFKDLTELRGMEREMLYLARHDPLTGLINRREFESRLLRGLESARLEGRRHALFYLDLDEFKVVNDTCGHLVGDEMLKQVTGLLRTHLRPFDTLARLGGDEFGVLLEDTSIERARQLGEGMREAIKRTRFVWQERIFDFGVSIGLVPINADSGDMGQVLSAADAACYVAKESGRNRIHEYQLDDSALAERHGVMQWISRIHKAFEEQRFCLYKQRIEALQEGLDCPVLFEVFIRMIDEEGAVVAPSAFIPAAERYHLASTLDRWVVHAAFVALACSTLSHDDPTCYAINLSGQSLGEESFLDYVLAEIQTTGVRPTRVNFEITETAAVANLDQATRFIAALKALGCGFVLDDFGSGLSSFAYLKNLRVDFLKIDGAFVRNMVSVPIQRALVESIHHIGQVMGIGTIAEAVEDTATLEALRGIGVGYAQGYAVAPPEPWA
jgi:diguanylate cyclase (GGDEF)-like protein/PAS domain S-box-containing protein